MHVKKIIGDKPVQSVATISAKATLAQAAGELAARRIGALVVSDSEGKVDGIISERDIVRVIAARGAEALSGRVSDAMTTNVTTCGTQDSADSVLDRMTRGRFRHMPVMEGGKMVGVISIGDVVKARMAEIEMENQAMESMIKGV